MNEALTAWISHVADLLDASIASERLEAGLHLVREFRATTGQLEARLVDLEGHLLEAIHARTVNHTDTTPDRKSIPEGGHRG